MQLGESLPHRAGREELQRRIDDLARQEGLAGAECDGAELHEQLVEQTGIVELADEITAAFIISACTGRTSPRAKRTSAPGMPGSVRDVKTYVGCWYGHGSG